MPWFNLKLLPEGVKRRICAYLIQRYLGQFFEEKLSSDQLTLNLSKGTVSVSKISLDVQALNELSEKQNWPVEFVDGYIDKLTVIIPFAQIFTESCHVEVNGLKITVQPKQRREEAPSMFESMWNSMTSSLKLADEFANESKNVKDEPPLEGIEIFAEAIDSVLRKVKVKFVDTVLQIEHVPQNSMTGVGIVINIDLIEYSDEAGGDPSQDVHPEQETEFEKKAYVVQTFTTKNFNIEGVTISTVEFSSKARTFSRSMMCDFSQEYDEDDNPFAELNEDFRSKTTKSEFNDERHTVLFAKFANRQLIKLHMKQSEDSSSPKVSFEVNLGHLVIFLSPRQVHMLSELALGLSSPDLEDHSNVFRKSRNKEKPMTAIDFQRVENELQLQMRAHASQGGGLQDYHGWSGPRGPLDEGSDSDEKFYPMNVPNEMYDSAMSGYGSSLESSISSSAPSTTFTEQTGRSRSRGQNIELDPTAKISHFQVQLASLAIVLLHEDLLNLNPNEHTLVTSSVIQMQQTANSFFDALKDFALLDLAESNFEKACLLFNDFCKLNHIRLLAVPVNIDVKEKKTMNSFSITGSLHASKLQILEYLYDSTKNNVDIIPMLKFEESSLSNPSLSFNFKHVQKYVSSRRKNCPKTEMRFNLGKCSIEFDITLIDRISALIHPCVVCPIEKKNNPHLWTSQLALLETQSKETVTEIKINTPNVNLKVRFPIPDFRPSHDLNRTPWWKRHVRPDHLILKCLDATFQTSFFSSQLNSEYTFQCRGVNVYYSETERGSPLYIAKIGQDDLQFSSMQDVSKHPRICVKIFPESKDLDMGDDEVMSQSSAFSPGAYFVQEDNGPFTSKKVFHHSNTPHDKNPDEMEELSVPGDKEEIENFKKTSIDSARMHIDIFLSTVKMQLVSKHIYELIYNRINNDLLLWESCAPKTKFPEGYPGVIPETQDIFSACRSGVQYESESDSEETSEGEGAILFYSAYDRPKSATSQVLPTNQHVKQCNLVLNLQISHGVLSCNPPVRDTSTKNVIPGQMGDFLLNVENATVFLVNGYKGDQDLGYLSVQVERAELLHCEMISSSAVKFNFARDKDVGRHLKPTIYKSEKGVLTEVRPDSALRDMLTVACKIATKHETHNAKTITIALGLSQATLRHRMCIEPNSWISQLLDFFNVSDYPIPGYKSKEVLTELHIHMWDCAIDYRPLYLPFRFVVTLGCFRMMSHLSEKSNTSTLRFIAEECNLFISSKAPPKNGVPSILPVNIRKNYVNVIYLGLFELSLRTSDKNSKIHPHIDMRASNDCVHIYTCSDSGRALTELITYIATDGDLKTNENISNADSAYSSPRHQSSDQELIVVEQPQDISKLTKMQEDQVVELLSDALEESDGETQTVTQANEDYSTGAKLFFFPDENQIIPPTTAACQPFPQVAKELGDFTSHSKDGDSDDDFIFVEKDTGLGLIPKSGVAEIIDAKITWTTQDSMRCTDNYFFVPIDKKDLLKTPSHFPLPKYKYMLCEMNIVWHMYGGNDFATNTSQKKEKKRKTVEFADRKLQDTVSYSCREEVKFTESQQYPKNKPHLTSLRTKGGVNRDHKVLMELELSKVKFLHEVYPDTTFHASRQVLLITELEIRDVLASSEFNKFLYQYTSEAKPKQSQGHMIIIRAVHIRPDKNLSAEECCLRLSLLPLRFNIDQDSLKFLVNFFTELGQGPNEESEVMSRSSSKQNTPTHQPPIMTINMEEQKKEVKDPVLEDNLILLDNSNLEEKPENSPENTPIAGNTNQRVFFRNVIFSPDVPIRIDYQGKRVEVSESSLSGLLLGLVMGLAQLNRSEIKLKRLSYRNGLLGVDKLTAFLLQEWLRDIKKNQLSSLLSGVGPINSIVQLFQGIRDLFWMPIEQYQKDGRIVRGIQRGANSFTTSTAMAALELTTRIIHLIQVTAETAYDMLSPGPSVRKIKGSKGRKKRYNQPQDIREGVANAYMVVKEGIGETAGNIVQVASHEHEQKGYTGAVGGVIREIPNTLLLHPIIICSEATSNVLGGMKSQLIPDARNEANQKWRTKDE